MHGFTELLLEEDADPVTDDQRRFLTTIRRNSERLLRLVNDLLLVSQARAGRLDLQKQDVDLVEIARHSVEGARAPAQKKELRLSFSAPFETLVVEADAGRLAQAIDNLLSNATKFTPAGGEVAVALALEGGHATVTVSDTGMGMSEAELERLFERFFRTSAAQARQIQGTGLGLAITKAIVDGHDGTVTVHSEPGVGTSFVIALPLPGEPRGSARPDADQRMRTTSTVESA